MGQVSTTLYFLFFLFIVPVTGICENTLMDLAVPYSFNSYALPGVPGQFTSNSVNTGVRS